MADRSDAPLVLVANRGEVAVRVIRAVADLGWRSCAVHGEEDGDALHVGRADRAVALDGRGAAPYLDAGRIVAAAQDVGADLLHPGYGFLSEAPELAAACAAAGIAFVGPSAEVLRLLGDKLAARRLAREHDVPLLEASDGAVTLDGARAFLASLGGAPMVLKAVAGGGGRGMRPVADERGLEGAYERCRSEALAAFGDGALYAERMLPDARHVEVQVVGDGAAVTHLGDRDCSLQRRHQKLVELAPAPGLAPDLRAALSGSAVRMAQAVGYAGLGTFEFLVDAGGAWAFIEANPRLQVEHTVTEECAGTDLVRAQLRLAAGDTLADVGLGGDAPVLRGAAVQARVNLERVEPDGTVLPTTGRLTAFEPPSGPGVRTDTAAHVGYEPAPAFDTLLAKVVAHAPDHEAALRRADRALGEFQLAGAGHNLGLLRAILRHPDVRAGRATTRFVDDHLDELLAAAAELAPTAAVPGDPPAGGDEPSAAQGAPPDSVPVEARLQATVVEVRVEPGDVVEAGATLAVLEAMKMEHVVAAPTGGTVRGVPVAVGDTVRPGAPVVFLEGSDEADDAAIPEAEPDPDHVRDDLAEVLERRALLADEQRPDAVAKRRAKGRRTARENIDDLVDDGSFVEYGGFVIAAQRQRRSQEELIERTPADGLVAGIGRVNGDRFGDEAARCAVLSYDYTVLAGTQGTMNHFKKDRLFDLVRRLRLPVVLFAEGGGGRPGDTDTAVVSGLHTMAFRLFAELSGLVPSVGIVGGYCFAGNAALLGCCDVVIATRDANIGMGGPAMIEGGGLGSYDPTEIGPTGVQTRSGVVDIAVEDEAAAVDAARRYLSYFQGPVDDWEAPDQRRLRHLVPENRRRVYDVRRVIATLADVDSVLELRRDFGRGIVTALVRVEGRPVGLLANDPAHLGGAIDSDGADKASRFLQLCDAFDLPVLSLCDTPGFLVGPEAEATGQVRHFARLFVTAASLTVPYLTVVLRKGYGLGAQAMAGGSFHAPVWTVSWPTGEFGGMNLEGAVQLGFRRELDAVEDPAEREELFGQMVELAYAHGKALNVATYFEIDDVIDPADTRARIVATLRSMPPPAPRRGRKRPMVDTW